MPAASYDLFACRDSGGMGRAVSYGDGGPVPPGCSDELRDLPVASPLGVPDGLVGEEGEAVTDGPGADKAHGLGVAGLAEQALAGPEPVERDVFADDHLSHVGSPLEDVASYH